LTPVTWIAANDEDDRDRRGADLLRQFLQTVQNDDANSALRQIGQLAGQAIIPTIHEAVFERDIAAFGIANVTKATAEPNQHRGVRFRRPAAQIRNHRHGALLCSRRERPNHCATERSNEFAPSKANAHQALLCEAPVDQARDCGSTGE
jgi:hypothetical protein